MAKPLVILALAVPALVGACTRAKGGGNRGANGPSAAPLEAHAIGRLFPLVDGNIFAYDTTDEETGHHGMFVTEVHGAGDGRFELRTGKAGKRVEIRPDGIVREDGTYLLKAPIVLGATWPGEKGGKVRVSAVDKAVKVPAGEFVGCVEIVEQGVEDVRRVTTAVFCPDVGIAWMEVEAWSEGAHGLEHALLRSFGAPVRLDPAPAHAPSP